MKLRYNHAFTFGFALESYDATGAQIPAQELRTAIIEQLARLSDTELIENCGLPFDSYEGAPPSCTIREALTILVSSCEEALDGSWDRSDDGFEAMIEVGDRAIAKLDGVRS